MTIWSVEIKALDKIYASFKGYLPDLEKELERLVVTDDENMLLVYARRCLEVIVTDLSKKELHRERGTEPLQRIIDKLNKEQKVPQNIIVSMQNVNSMSTFGAHPKDFELKQVKPVLSNLETIISWYIKYRDIKVDGKALSESKNQDTVRFQLHKSRKKGLLIVGAVLAALLVVTSLFWFDVIVMDKWNDSEPINSIAVLPLANLTGQEENIGLTDVIHDALIGELGKLSNLRVISRTSTQRYRKHNMLLKDIAKELDVNCIVEGSVTKIEDSLGIIIQLIEVFPKERHLLANEYHDNIKNVLKIQSAAVKDIAKGINVKLTKEEEQRLDQPRTVNPETYQAYIRGMHHLSLGTPEEFKKGIDYLLEAIKIDPGDPFAYAALALGFATQGHGTLEAEEAFRQAESAANTALKIDPAIDEAHTALAMLYLYDSWDWPKANEAFENAVIANPNNDLAHAHFAWYHMLYYDKEKSLFHAKEAAIINPFSVAFKSWLAALYYNFEEYEEAEIWANKALALDEKSPYGNLVLAWINVRNKEFMKAREIFEKLPKGGYWNAIRVDGYVKTGQREKAMDIWNEMEEKAKTQKVNACNRGMMAASLGYLDKAFEYLNEAVENKIYPIAYIHLYQCADNLKKDPRFNELRLKLNLPANRVLLASYQ